MTKLCECGCGHPAPIAKRTNNAIGHRKGEPIRFILGHNSNSQTPTWDRIEEDPETHCWNWTGANNGRGYGAIGISGRTVATHRAYYEHYVRPIPDGLTIDHLCRNPACCNPGHLEPVTIQENIRRAGEAITHCKHGHEFTPENTYIWSGHGRRKCRTCHRERARSQG